MLGAFKTLRVPASFIMVDVMKRISIPHIFLLLLISIGAIALNISAIKASPSLFNLIIVTPIGVLTIGLIIYIALSTTDKIDTSSKVLIGDLVLLGIFALFCIGLLFIGFDVATFLFVWVGILLSKPKNKIIPPIYAAGFTFILVKGFGSLFPFPMPLMVF